MELLARPRIQSADGQPAMHCPEVAPVWPADPLRLVSASHSSNFSGLSLMRREKLWGWRLLKPPERWSLHWSVHWSLPIWGGGRRGATFTISLTNTTAHPLELHRGPWRTACHSLHLRMSPCPQSQNTVLPPCPSNPGWWGMHYTLLPSNELPPSPSKWMALLDSGNTILASPVALPHCASTTMSVHSSRWFSWIAILCAGKCQSGRYPFPLGTPQHCSSTPNFWNRGCTIYGWEANIQIDVS